MQQFQYQAQTEPVVAAPETVTVDRWLPCWAQPSRALVSIAALVSGMVAPILPPLAATTPTALHAPDVQPSRAIPYAQGTTHAEPLSTGAETVTADRWLPTVVQPRRTPTYATGTTAVAPVSTSPEVTSADRWLPTVVQPRRTPTYAAGTASAAPLSETPESVTIDRWQVACPQPIPPRRLPLPSGGVVPVLVPSAPTTPSIDWLVQQPRPGRQPRSPAVTGYAIPPATAPEATAVDKWSPAWTQPDRSVKRASGLSVVPPSTGRETVTVDRWAPTTTQPLPRPTRTQFGGSVAPVLIPATAALPSLDWLVQTVQPRRVPLTRPPGGMAMPVVFSMPHTGGGNYPVIGSPIIRRSRRPS